MPKQEGCRRAQEARTRSDGAHELRPPLKPYADFPHGQARTGPLSARSKSNSDGFPDAFPETGITNWRPESSRQLLFNPDCFEPSRKCGVGVG